MIDLKLTISDAQLRRAVAAMIIFEVALAALNFAPFPWPTIERQLSLESEGNFPTWLASMQLFVMAVVAWFIGRQATPERGQRMLWGAASVVLLLISIDEVSTTHEILGHDAAQRLGLPTWPSPTWMLIFAPCILIGLGLLYWVIFRGLRGDRLAFRLGLAGVLLWAGALALEATRGWMIGLGCDPVWGGARPQPVLEELFELAGGTLLLAGMAKKLGKSENTKA